MSPTADFTDNFVDYQRHVKFRICTSIHNFIFVRRRERETKEEEEETRTFIGTAYTPFLVGLAPTFSHLFLLAIYFHALRCFPEP